MRVDRRDPSAHRTGSVEETEALGRALGAQLHPGDVVLLTGELGAGKTAFVRGLAQGLGVDPDEVSSPTFTLMQEYRGRVTLCHLDLYRIEGEADIEDLGLDDAAAGAVLAIEWAERMGVPPAGAWRVELRVAGDAEREVVVVPPVAHSTR